jgi:hypothetical protein
MARGQAEREEMMGGPTKFDCAAYAQAWCDRDAACYPFSDDSGSASLSECKADLTLSCNGS